jgi:acetate kinase
VIAFLRETIGTLPTAIGHRVVHGGPNYAEPTIVNPAVLNQLERLTPLAPLHQPHNLGLIRLIAARQPHLLQVACFDTAFHRGHADVADRYAIPEALYSEGVRRYGFHGLSYEYIAAHLAETLPEVAAGRVVVAHLEVERRCAPSLRAEAWKARWASPRSMGSPWERGPVSSMPAFSSIS